MSRVDEGPAGITGARAETAAAEGVILQQFVREPRPGAVKTRMSPRLSAQECLALHCELALHTLEQLRSAALGELELWVSGDPWHAFFASWEGCATRHRQCGADLGERMYAALAAGLRRRARVLLVGSDCPFLDAGYLQDAADALLRHDVVLGPARDGGYVLVGARLEAPAIFSGVEWGTSAVLQQTLARVRRAGLRCRLMPERADIDTPDDLPLWHSVRDQPPASLT